MAAWPMCMAHSAVANSSGCEDGRCPHGVSSGDSEGRPLLGRSLAFDRGFEGRTVPDQPTGLAIVMA
eukprot:5447540-Alexandrium_andersonii.AAC.1